MAFPVVSGYQNLPQGNFSPVIYSQKVLKFFRKASVAEDITNTDYEGEIANYGDSVKIISEPTVVVRDWQRGTNIQVQDLDDSDQTMVVDQGKYFSFNIDDVEKKHSHVNWEALATSSGAYALRDSYDTNILTYADGQVTAGLTYGSNASPVDVGFDAGEIAPANVLGRLARMLDEVNCPEENRWVVARPAFWEQLRQTGSKLMEVQVTGDGKTPIYDAINNGRVSPQKIHGFTCYKSNNLPNPSGSNATHAVLAGHKSAVATANHIAKTEVLRSQNSFADIVRGLHIFGRKALRADTAIAKAFVLID